MAGARLTLAGLERLAQDTYVAPGALAIAYASLGDESRAKTQLRREASRADLGKAITEIGRKRNLQPLVSFAQSLKAFER